MTVSVVEVVKGGFQSTNASVSLTTTPSAGDVVILVAKSIRAAGGRNVTAVSGLGATWSQGYFLTGARISVWIGTGATTSGAVSVTYSGSGAVQATLYTLRGLTSTTTVAVRDTFSGASSLTGTAQTAGAGQIVLAGIAYQEATASSLTTFTYPSATTPSGWTNVGTNQDTSSGSGDAYRIPSSSASHSTSFSADLVGSGDIVQVVIGTEEVAGSVTGSVAATLPALTAAVAGTVTIPPTTGDIAATLPALTAQATGTVAGAPTTGDVAATLPALTASIDGDVTTPTEGVTVVELAKATAAYATTHTVALAATPQVGDLVIVTVGHSITTTGRYVDSVSGLGATWTEVHESAVVNSPVHTVWIGTGATTSGNITVVMSSARQPMIHARLVRGLSSTEVVAETVRTIGDTALAGPSATAGEGQIAVAIAGLQWADGSWPTSQTPPGAWTAEAIEDPGANEAFFFATGHAIPSTSGTHQTSASMVTSGRIALSQVIIGTENAGAVSGAVAATLPALTAAATVDVAAGPVTGAVQAVLPALTADIEGVIPGETITGTMAATLPALTATIIDTPGQTIASGFTFGSTLATPLIVARAGTMAAGFAFGSRLNQTRDHTPDPRTGRPQRRLIITHRDGTRYGEIPHAAWEPIEDGVRQQDTFAFTIATDDPRHDLITPVAREVQVWRGRHLELVGPILPNFTTRDGATTYHVADPSWYLEGRQIDRRPKRNLLLNGSFEDGLNHWQGGYAEGSIPPVKPAVEVVDVDFFGEDRKALQVTGQDYVTSAVQSFETAAVFAPNSATFLSGGQAIVTAAAQKVPQGIDAIHIEGHTAWNYLDGDNGMGFELSLARANAAKPLVQAVHPTATITTEGKGRTEPLNNNSTYALQAANRRVELHYAGTITAEGHRQYEFQPVQIVNPVESKRDLPVTFAGWFNLVNYIEASKDGYGVQLVLVKTSDLTTEIEEAHSTIDDKTPRGIFERAEATVTVPSDGISYTLLPRIYPPDGDIQWTECGLYPHDALFFPTGTDQALIVKGAVEHVQDPTFGHGPLGIGTHTPLTGVTRRREYLFSAHWTLPAALDQLTAVQRGMDIEMHYTHDTRVVKTHYPRMGSDSGLTLTHGGNIARYEPVPISDIASSIIVQADTGSGASRDEAFAFDEAALDGLLLEETISAEKETPVTELGEGARQALARSSDPKGAVWVYVHPDHTSEVRDKVGKGDTVRVAVPGVGERCRVIRRRLDAADHLALLLVQEA